MATTGAESSSVKWAIRRPSGDRQGATALAISPPTHRGGSRSTRSQPEAAVVRTCSPPSSARTETPGEAATVWRPHGGRRAAVQLVGLTDHVGCRHPGRSSRIAGRRCRRRLPLELEDADGWPTRFACEVSHPNGVEPERVISLPFVHHAPASVANVEHLDHGPSRAPPVVAVVPPSVAVAAEVVVGAVDGQTTAIGRPRRGWGVAE